MHFIFNYCELTIKTKFFITQCNQITNNFNPQTLLSQSKTNKLVIFN